MISVHYYGYEQRQQQQASLLPILLQYGFKNSDP